MMSLARSCYKHARTAAHNPGQECEAAAGYKPVWSERRSYRDCSTYLITPSHYSLALVIYTDCRVASVLQIEDKLPNELGSLGKASRFYDVLGCERQIYACVSTQPRD